MMTMMILVAEHKQEVTSRGLNTLKDMWTTNDLFRVCLVQNNIAAFQTIHGILVRLLHGTYQCFWYKMIC